MKGKAVRKKRITINDLMDKKRAGIPLVRVTLYDYPMARLAEELTHAHPEIGAILLECSDLPPYAYDIPKATGLPVYDFITLINWVHSAVAQEPYYGYL